MRKKVEFYNFSYDISNQITTDSISKSNTELRKEFLNNILNISKKFIKNKNDFSNKDNNFIEFIEAEDKHIFGILGKKEDVAKGTLKRIRDNLNGKSVSKINYTIEYYRYFYLDLNTKNCSVLYSSQAPAFRNIFSDFLNIYSPNYIKNIKVLPVIDTNILEKMKKNKKIFNMNFLFKGDSVQGNNFLYSLKENFSISQKNIRNVKLNLKFYNQPVNQEILDLAKEDSNILNKDFEKIEMVLGNETAKDSIELINKILTKTTIINLAEDSLINQNNLDEIKKALREELNNINNI